MAKGKTLKEAAAEKLEKAIVVNGITVEGVTRESLNDYEIMEALFVMSDPDSSGGEKLRAISSLCPLMFGSAQWKRVKAELREQNDGKLTAETVNVFVNDVLAAVKAKNS